jgi:hypothetical protein
MNKPVVFGVNPRDKACGIAQFGLNLEAVLKHSEKFTYAFREPVTEVEYRMLLDEYQPSFILWNYYPMTLPWVNLKVLNMARERGIRQASIFHEVPVTGFDALIYPDPTFQPKSEHMVDWYSIGRPIPSVRKETGTRFIDLDHPIIGSSGFGFENKGYVRLVERVNEEFQHATIRFHLPYARWGDEHGERARRVADWCRAAAKPSIKLEFIHDFKSPADYIDWLAENDINAFLYDEMPGRGIASTIDFALMANRPIAVTRTTMFRHLNHLCPSVCVEDRSLRDILKTGILPLMDIQKDFAPEKICAAMDAVVESVMAKRHNRLLTNEDRKHYEPMILEMRESCPDIMARKIPEANVQQAWVLDMVRRTQAKSILCVGCFEDTAYHTLEVHGWDVEGIDPALDMSLSDYRRKVGTQFPCVFATSVIEHVPNDEQFIRDLCDSLEYGGTCILTADFKEGWRKGQPVPATSVRFYTSADIVRIGKILTEKGCYFIDKPDTSGAPDFHYQGHNYSFIGLIFKKL